MDDPPDITQFFAIHRQLRLDVARYLEAMDLVEASDRARLDALARWSDGFIAELAEHHYVEDTFFFPSLRAKVPSAGPVLDALDAQHHQLANLLDQWRQVASQLADPTVAFAPVRAAGLAVGAQTRELLDGHLAMEEADALPLFWRHYTVEEYDAVWQQAVAAPEESTLWFVVPWNVDALGAFDETARDTLLASVPAALRDLYDATRDGFRALVDTAFAGVAISEPDAAPSR